MKEILELGKISLAVVIGGWTLGLLLDEAGKAPEGSFFQKLATKATNGFGK